MIIYIHGFNSTSASRKAHQVRDRLAREGRAHQFRAPDLPYDPSAAMDLLQREVEACRPEELTLIGSSLGGYYATALSERYGVRAVPVNPAIDPHVGLAAYLGPQRNLYSGETWELTRAHLAALESMYVERLTPTRYLLVVTTGDELLDYRVALERYRGARSIVVQGSDHGFLEFERWLDPVWEFAGVAERTGA